MYMRTAHEWYLKINSFANPDEMRGIEREWIERQLREIQIEAIKECAEVAKTKTESFYGRDDKLHDRQIVDEQSILSLIEQVK